MTESLAPRSRKVKILATLGPPRASAEMIRKLMLAGADAFRINMSHGDQKQKAKLVEHIRALEKEFSRPTTILFDLQGPKLRVGHFEGGRAMLEKGKRFIFDRDDEAGRQQRASSCPTPSCSQSVRPGTNILIDDGKVRLNVLEADARPDRHRSEGRRRGVRQQGRQRPRRGRADPGADRQGPRRSAVRARAAGRLDRAVVRPAARGRRRGADADRRPGGAAREDRKARGDRPAERYRRARRRGDGRARRSWRRASARAGAAAAEARSSPRARQYRQAGGGRDADARIDDHLADADARRGQRRRDGDL